MEVYIRAESPADYDAIDRLNELAFGQPQEAALIRRLRLRTDFIPQLSLLAFLEEQAVGHILFSPIVIEHGQGRQPALALAPMAVHPAHQRRGIGSRLVRQGLERARALGHASVIVLGHAAYYPRFGFQPAARWGIEPPFDVPSEVFMALELRPGALLAGRVRYPPEFAEV
ncbi:MAG: N-acetyltransferase [Bacteroidetes bacterium]|nr:MAG: N-acetyltransferase [Bacteroidota bacterium]